MCSSDLDLLGRIHKISKNNIKRAGNRSLEFFGYLPEEIQLVLGENMDENVWEKLKEQDLVPLTLRDYVPDFSEEIYTRSKAILKDSHLLESSEAGQVRFALPGDLRGNGVDDAEVADLDDDDLLPQLVSLHENNV